PAEPSLAEHQEGEEARFQEEREQPLHRQGLTDDPSGVPGEARPVRAELELHGDTRDDAHGEVDAEDADPEPGRVVPPFVAAAEADGLHHDDEQSQAHRQLGEVVVVDDREGELQPVPEERVGHSGSLLRCRVLARVDESPAARQGSEAARPPSGRPGRMSRALGGWPPARAPRREDLARIRTLGDPERGQTAPGGTARYTDGIAMAPSLMEAEIRSQPAMLARLVEDAAPLVTELGRAIARRRPRFAVLAARGSSDHAAIYGKYLLETQAGLVASLAAPSVYSLYERSPDVRDALAIGISQSGQSPDIVAA